MSLTTPTTSLATSPNAAVPDLTLIETLRVLEVARGMQRERSVAEQALARNELRDVLKKRLLDAAVVTGDQVTEADVDAAISQYFARLHAYQDPPLTFAVLLAHGYVRRFEIALIAGLSISCYALWKIVF